MQGHGLFHDVDYKAYADLEIDGHRETWPIRSEQFKRWLTRQFWQRIKTAPNSEALNSAIRLIEAQACFEGPRRTVFTRVAGIKDHTLYLDLCDEDWRAVKITADGWKVVNKPVVRFIRRKGMHALPAPVKGGSMNDLRPFINVEDEGDFVLIICWLLAAFRHRGPYTTLFVWGEAGSAKSTLLRLLRQLIDPNTAPVRAPPRENRDLFIAATNSYVPCFDNLSSLSEWLSDTLARLNTGGGFGTRQLYTDDEERLFDAARPLLLGAIENVIEKGDLAERAIPIKLSHIPDDERLEEKELWRKFRRVQPQILGALLTAASSGLEALPKVTPAKLPRMADFAKWAIACERALWKPGTFMTAYRANRAGAIADVVEANLVGSVLQSFIAERQRWTGTATQLLELLDNMVDDQQRANKSWPKAANALAGKLTRLASDFRKSGIDISDSGRDSATNRKLITIQLAKKVRTGSLGSLDRSENSRTKALKGKGNNDPNDSNDPIPRSLAGTSDIGPEDIEIIHPIRLRPAGKFVWNPNKAKRDRIVRQHWLESQRRKRNQQD